MAKFEENIYHHENYSTSFLMRMMYAIGDVFTDYWDAYVFYWNLCWKFCKDEAWCMDMLGAHLGEGKLQPINMGKMMLNAWAGLGGHWYASLNDEEQELISCFTTNLGSGTHFDKEKLMLVWESIVGDEEFTYVDDNPQYANTSSLKGKEHYGEEIKFIDIVSQATGIASKVEANWEKLVELAAKHREEIKELGKDGKDIDKAMRRAIGNKGKAYIGVIKTASPEKIKDLYKKLYGDVDPLTLV